MTRVGPYASSGRPRNARLEMRGTLPSWPSAARLDSRGRLSPRGPWCCVSSRAL